MQKLPYRVRTRRNMPRYILIKPTKTKYKERIKGRREKQQVTYKGNSTRIKADLSAETL